VKIVSVTTRNFKNLPDRKWSFDEKFQVVSGLNEAGKSSLLEAILVGLYGDATSTDSRYEGARRWKSPEHIYVALDFLLRDIHCTVERDFENRKNRLVHDDNQVRAKDKIRTWLEEHLPLPSEQAFLQTACVRQSEINCDIDASDLRSQIEQHSLSATGQNLEELGGALKKRVDELRRGWLTPAPKNPGPIKQLSDELARLQQELADLERKEAEANQALAEYEEVAAQVEKLEEELRRDEERLRLDREFLDADRIYKQRSAEIRDLKAKTDRLAALPQFIEAAESDHEKLQTSLAEHRSRLERVQSWVQKRSELKECERSLAALSADMAQLKACAEEMQLLKDPLQSTQIVPEDFARFRTLQGQLAECKTELEKDRAEGDQLATELEEAQKQLVSYSGSKQRMEEAIEKLKAEKVRAERADEAKKKLVSIAQEKTRIGAKVEQIESLDSEKTALEQDLAGYKALEGVSAQEFRGILTSAEALEAALQSEGIGFEIQPERTIRVTLQVDGSASESVVLQETEKFLGRREILVQIPGLGQLRLTNESQTSRQLAERRDEITKVLARASAADPEDLLRRLEHRDKLMGQLTTSAAKLQTASESRPLKEWDADRESLDKELSGLSGEIAELGTTRDLSAIAEDLQANGGTLTQIAGGTAQAQTRIQLLTRQLEAGRKRIADREDQLGKLQNGIVTLLTRAGQDGEAGLKALEESCQEYQAKASGTEARKARILKGRLEGDIRSRYGSEEKKVHELKQQLEQLAPYALNDEQLSGLHTQIEALEKAVREVSDKIAGLKRERELHEAEQLDKKYEEAVTQAAIAEKNRKEYEAYAFATPGERIDSNRRIQEPRADLKALQNRRAELKVKSDAAGLGQSRIPELKEAIADRDLRLCRLKHRFETDTRVFEYLGKARDKAFADLLAAIPSGVGKLFDRITAGKYERVEGTGFKLQPWSGAKGEKLEVQEMSGGTMDQFYLSLRLEASQAIFPDDPPPLILDDALVSSDPQRRAAILTILEEYSTTGQVLFLTCQDWPQLRKYSPLRLG